ncbi:hypothetical protein QN277_010225 [Acacia crassicarpa]|uniref:Uncharacterized protein n=1 Tax=Acacia crassicarpa TaxID=499986 RepID=A0AAE1M5A2_9FABA|nr:hypothetical protein QN277_010225 [Acacia crassicarpa]
MGEERNLEMARPADQRFQALLPCFRHRMRRRSGVMDYGVMQVTNTRNEQLETQLSKNARPETTMMGQVNKERLAEFLGELQRKEDTNGPYVAALKGETLTRKPYVRIQPVPKQNDAGVDKEQKK